MYFNLKQRLISDSIWAFGAKIGTGISQVFVGIMLTRILTPNDFGVFQVVLRVIVFCAILGSSGMGWVVVRLVAEGITHGNPEQCYHIAKKVFQLVLFLSGLLAILNIFFGEKLISSLFHISIDGSSYILALLIIAAAFQQIIPECFRGLHDIHFASLFSGLATNMLFLCVLIFVWLVFEETSFIRVLELFTLTSCFVVSVSSFFLRKKLCGIKQKDHHGQESYLDILKISLPLLCSTLLLFFISQADVWIVASFFATEVAAYYAAASRLIIILTVPLMIANAVIKPIVTDLWIKKKKERLESLLRNVASITFVISIFPAIVFVFWPDAVLGFLYGSFYRNGDGVMKILTIGQLMTVALGPCSVLLVMTGRQVYLLLSTCIGSSIFITATFVLYKIMGHTGIAMSVVIGTVAIQGLATYYCWRKLGIKTYIRFSKWRNV